MGTSDRIQLFILFCLVGTTVFTGWNLYEARKWFENDLRPWVKIENETYPYQNVIQIKQVISNVGKTPAFIRSTSGKFTIGDITDEIPPKVGTITVMPGGHRRATMFTVQRESYLAVLAGEKRLTLEFNINYSKSKDSRDDYQTRESWEFRPIRQNVEIPKEGKIQISLISVCCRVSAPDSSSNLPLFSNN